MAGGGLRRVGAAKFGALIRFGIVVVTLVVAAPLITGTDDGAISRVGAVALGALGLAAVPVLGTAATGIVVMFGRGLRVGEHAGPPPGPPSSSVSSTSSSRRVRRPLFLRYSPARHRPRSRAPKAGAAAEVRPL
jgi:hypothetical protein